MAIRHQAVTQFNDGEGIEGQKRIWADKWDKDPKNIRVKPDMSGHRMTGIQDPLHAALSAKTMHLPRDNHEYRPSPRVHPTGVHYNPAGEFGHRSRTGAGSTHQIYGPNRYSAPSANAVPGNQNTRRGDNALPGHQNTRRGQNAVGSPPNRTGGNSVGSPPNRYGENALASGWRPTFSRPHGHRV